MIYEVVVVYDKAAMVFQRPVFMVSLGLAVRQFMDEVNRVQEGNVMREHPADFSLWHLGQFEDASGRFDLSVEPRKLHEAVDMISKGE